MQNLHLARREMTAQFDHLSRVCKWKKINLIQN